MSKTVIGINILVFVFAVQTAYAREAVADNIVIEEYDKDGKQDKTEKMYVIEVTADKREKEVKDLPFSLTVLEGNELEKRGIETAGEVAPCVPNTLLTGTPVRNVFVIRGISSFATSIYSPVGMYIDDVCMPLHLSNNPDLYDIERIEILKGPQGVLYGRNSEAGVINIVTRKPGNETRGWVKEEFSLYDTSHGYAPSNTVSSFLSLPVKKDLVYFGIGGAWKRSDGYIKNKYNDDEQAADISHLNLRGTLRVTPNRNWDIVIDADGLKNDDGMSAFRFEDGVNASKRYEVDSDAESFSEQRGYGQSLKIEYKAPAFTLLSVTGHRYYENDYQNDLDCTSNPVTDRGANHFKWENRIISEELRLVSKEKTAYEWLVGLYGFNEETGIEFENTTLARQTETDIDIQGCSAFGQGTLAFYNIWRLTAGLRFDRQDLDGDFTDLAGSTGYGKELSYNELLPKMSLSCTPFNENMLVYLGASKGYMTGGYNYARSSDLDSFTYGPEYTWNYELGMKTGWLKGKIGLDLSLYYIDIKDKQVFEIDRDTMASKVENAARAHSVGAEIQGFIKLGIGITVYSTFGYSDARFDSWKATENHGTVVAPDIVEVDYKDKRLPYSPKYTYTTGVFYETAYGFLAGVDLHGNGGFYTDSANTLKEPGHVIVDTRLACSIGHFEFSIWCKNIFDREYATYRDTWSNATLVIDGAPRCIGFAVKGEL